MIGGAVPPIVIDEDHLPGVAGERGLEELQQRYDIAARSVGMTIVHSGAHSDSGKKTGERGSARSRRDGRAVGQQHQFSPLARRAD